MHFDGADVESLTYRISFAEPDRDGRPPLQLHGQAVAQDLAQTVHQ